MKPDLDKVFGVEDALVSASSGGDGRSVPRQTIARPSLSR